MKKSQEINFIHYADGEFTPGSAQLPSEQALTLIVNGKAWMEMICTPSMIEELVVGFLYNERLIDSKEDISRLYVCDDADHVEVDTLKEIEEADLLGEDHRLLWRPNFPAPRIPPAANVE